MNTFVVAALVSCLGLVACGPGGGGSADGPLPDVALIASDMSSDSGIRCEYPQTPPPGFKNDPACPATYGGHLFSLCTPPNQPCTPSGLTCRYYGVGDGVPGCFDGTEKCTEMGHWGPCIGGVHAIPPDNCFNDDVNTGSALAPARSISTMMALTN